MCTVTILPLETGIRLAANRDESPARPAALPPGIVTIGPRQALMPIDPLSGGTWIAATDAGLMFTLLNIYTGPRDPNAPTPRVSRGTLIPWLASSETLEEAFARTQELNVADLAPFRLILADRGCVADLCWTGESCTRNALTPIMGPILFTSSGLGDGLVDPPRRALFAEFFAKGADRRDRQDAYHRHSWPDRPHLSVCMRRPEARTISLTIIELEAGCLRMDYYADAPDQAVSPSFA